MSDERSYSGGEGGGGGRAQIEGKRQRIGAADSECGGGTRFNETADFQVNDLST